MADWFKVVFIIACYQIMMGNAARTLPDCKDHEFHYESTECGSDGGRWHVPVPHDVTHCSVKSKPAVRQKSCDFVCPPGQYSDVSLFSEECKPCPKGTRSHGGAVRYTNWTILPPEFDTYSVKNDDGEGLSAMGIQRCNSSWVADMNGKVLRTDGTSCTIQLTYSTTIVGKEGALTFSYYYDTDMAYFAVYAKNEQCQISKQADKDGDMSNYDYYSNGRKTAEPSENYQWKNLTLKLKRGKNLVVWTAEFWMYEMMEKSKAVILIRDIEVKGSSLSSECSPCPAGTFAPGEGSDWCQPCPENEISNEGSDSCTPCNTKKEYAPRRSAVCLKRPPCKKTDYIETSSACDKDNKFRTVYEWIKPQICSDTVKKAVKLPSPGPKNECPPCNPGMYLNGSQCLWCPAGTFSDGKKPCAKCPTFTAPALNHEYRYWKSWPSTTKHWCSSYANGCSTPKGWQLRGYFLDSGLGHSDDVTMYFEVETKGFAGERGLVSRTASAVGTVTIDFQLDCDGPCVFKMFEKMEGRGLTRLTEWSGREPRQNFSYQATSKGHLSYVWRFQKRESEEYTSEKQYRYSYDRVKIYSVVLSNTLDGGASTCRKCSIGVHQSGCVECSGGQYINAETKKCEPCAAGTYLSNNECVKCGPGLTSNAGSTQCYSSCTYHAKDGRHIDFGALKGNHSLQTSMLYFSEGTAYFYEYHINLCGIDAPPVSCHSNNSFLYRKQEVHHVSASICQMRILPAKNGGSAFASDTAGIGHQLMGVYEEKPENLSLDVFQEEKLLNESLLYFDYLSHSKTPFCPNGRSAWIILRCDPDSTGKGIIKLPPQCLEGTCDGCQFVFLWHTMFACPVCSQDHYYEIETACVNRKKNIRYSWKKSPKDCVGGVKLPAVKVFPCSDMSVHEAMKQFQILIGIVAFVVTATIASLAFLWYKNRALKYKLYRRVAVNDSHQEGELPQAESCVPDDDDEQERVEFKKGRKPGDKLFKKLRDRRSKQDETAKFSDSFEVDLN